MDNDCILGCEPVIEIRIATVDTQGTDNGVGRAHGLNGVLDVCRPMDRINECARFRQGKPFALAAPGRYEKTRQASFEMKQCA